MMNVFPLNPGGGASPVGDVEALTLMLDYIVAEAERLGLDVCAHHADAARAATIDVNERPARFRL